jgi:hypothetical protein
MGQVYLMAELCGIDRVPDVYRYVELLGEKIGEHIFEKTHKISPRTKQTKERKRFIAVWKSRYEQTYDLEYGRSISQAEGKLIRQANDKLAEFGFTADEYLAWLFEEFLPENPRLCPPQIKMFCGIHFLNAFLDANREIREARMRQEVDKAVGLDLIARSRVLMRSEGQLLKSERQNVREAVKKYGDKDIMLHEFRKIIEGFEKKLRQGKPNAGVADE